jgi:iron complex outermembrane receptor protein
VWADDARATDAPVESGIDTIVITARKRPEPLEKTPAAVSVIDAEALAGSQVRQLADAAWLLPNVDINRFGVGNPSHAAVFIRGIGVQDHIITTDPAVGLYVDGVYVGRQMGANLRLAHVERVEVLRGPQGTLYGRNTLGGAVNVVLRQPGDEVVRRWDLGLGTRGRAEGSVYLNQQLNDDVAWLVSAQATRRDGVGRALLVDAPKAVGEEAEAIVRLAARWKASPELSLTLALDSTRGVNGKSPSTIEIFDPNGFFPSQLGLSASQLPRRPDDSNSGQASLFRQTNTVSGASLRIDGSLGRDVHGRLLVAARESRYTGGLDDDHTLPNLASFPERGQARQATLEAQVDAKLDRFDVVAGLYAGRERGRTNSGPWVYVDPGGYFDITQTMRTLAAYGHAGFALTPSTRVGAGLRHSRESKHASAQFDSWADPSRVARSASWSSATGELSISHAATAALNLYALWSTGFQSGAFPARPFAGPETFLPYRPTRARNLEWGTKWRWDPSLRANLALFRTHYDDLPLPVAEASGSGYVFLMKNGGRAVSQGVEMEGLLALQPQTDLRVALGYIDARVREVPANSSSVRVGDRLPLTSRWTASVGLHGRQQLGDGRAGTFEQWLDLAFRSPQFAQLANSEHNRIGARALVNLRLTWTPASSACTWAFYGRNLLDKVYDVARLDSGFAGFTEIIRSNDRREFGIQLRHEH